jgi:hypothetical protein
MNIISCSLRDELSVDFSRARAQLAEARLRQDKKDTSANRAAVAECWTRIDAILDMYLLDTYFQEGAMTERAPCTGVNDYPGSGGARW